jgi:hypothetical protein
MMRNTLTVAGWEIKRSYPAGNHAVAADIKSAHKGTG